MNRKMLDILVCPKCKGFLTPAPDEKAEIIEGMLSCSDCREEYPIIAGIPRFVPKENYGSSFGFQWNLFRRTQLDSFNGTTLSADRFWSETSMHPDELKGRWVLDAGCGAGRFLDTVSAADCDVVGVDISNAVDAAAENLADRRNVHLVQASLYELPFRNGAFDLCYSIGVIQHTPEPQGSVRALAEMVTPAGRLALTIYPRKIYTRLNAKYLIRPITKRVSKKKMLLILKRALPILFPVTGFLFRLPLIGKVSQFLIPIANYVNEPQLTRSERCKWALLDTFDMLTPHYDQPMTEKEARLALSGFDLEYLVCKPEGLNIVVEMKSTKEN